MIKILYSAAAVAVALVPVAAMAGPNSQSGIASNGMSWTATSHIVGQNSTATIPSGGNPAYLATNAQGYSGVVGLLMTYNNGDQFVCSGSLTAGNRIVTAAHCISNGYASNVNGKAADLVRTQAFFYDGVSQGPDAYFYPAPGLQPGITAIDVATYHTNAGYTGEVIDQNDIAVLQLAQAAPNYAQIYGLYTGELTGQTFNVAGLGTRSLTGGIDGYTGPGAGAGVGRRRQGDNVYDYAWGDAVFDGLFTNYDPECNNPPGSDPDGGTNWFCGYADIEYSYISDFDRFGSTANNQACFVAQAVTGMAVPQFCGQAVGPSEVSIAGGDSGGPGFINGQLASVNSYGLTFGTGFGDIKGGLQSSFGELNGFVPVFIHTEWIAAVPEPSTWALLILGFGVAGVAMRRKAKLQARFA